MSAEPVKGTFTQYPTKSRLPWLSGKPVSRLGAAPTSASPKVPGSFIQSSQDPQSPGRPPPDAPYHEKTDNAANLATLPPPERCPPSVPRHYERAAGPERLVTTSEAPRHLPQIHTPPARHHSRAASLSTVSVSSTLTPTSTSPNPKPLRTHRSFPTLEGTSDAPDHPKHSLTPPPDTIRSVSPHTLATPVPDPFRRGSTAHPMTDAINRFEDLIEEANKLVHEAERLGPRAAEHNMDLARDAMRRASVVKPEPLAPRPRMLLRVESEESGNHPFQDAERFQDVTSSSLSSDELYSSASSEEYAPDRRVSVHPPTPDRRTSIRPPTPARKLSRPQNPEPVVRDFGQPQEEHWMGRKPSTKYPDATDIPSQAAPLSDGSTLRHRKPSHQPTDPAPEPWAPRRHNTLVEGIAEEPAPPVPLSWESERTKTPRRPLPFSSPQYEEHVDPEKGHHRLRRIAHFKSDSRDHSPHLHHSRRHPIARKWSTPRKRIVATVACINTGIIGFVVGIYAGMVPRIQFQLADQRHEVIRGNVLLYFGLAITTFLTWPLPLLHGRKPYILGALAIILPLQFPQAVIVSLFRTPKLRFFHLSVVICRFCTGLVLGFANVNCFTVLLDLFGASLQSSRPHQEIVVYNDIRRDGGGMGVWLGIWTWCFIGSIGVGFFCGAAIIGPLNPAWGFYVTIIVISCVIVINVIMPETRRSAHRRTVRLNIDSEEKLLETTIWGEAKLHVTGVSPRNWLQEVWAGLVLNQRMLRQQGFVILAVYVAWIYAMVVLVIILLGALLSRSYRLQPKFVGLGVFSISVGALLAVPLSKASLLSRDRKQGPRTDSMTFDREISWSSHLARRLIFMTLLPLAGAAYTVTSPGVSVHFMAPILFAGTVGFLSNLAIAECMGLVMETFDTSDLQPGVNSRHRLQSLAEDVRRRRTNYSSFPRVAAGVFMMQSLGFVFAACATEGGGSLTRNLGARLSTGVVAIILAILTVLLTLSLWRFRSIRVLPDHSLGTRVNTNEWTEQMQDPEWKPVVVGNPSGKMRRMSLLEMGSQSRWTEIRRLNKLLE